MNADCAINDKEAATLRLALKVLSRVDHQMSFRRIKKDDSDRLLIAATKAMLLDYLENYGTPTQIKGNAA